MLQRSLFTEYSWVAAFKFTDKIHNTIIKREIISELIETAIELCNSEFQLRKSLEKKKNYSNEECILDDINKGKLVKRIESRSKNKKTPINRGKVKQELQVARHKFRNLNNNFKFKS